MDILYLVIIILGTSIQSVVKKAYTEKTSGKGAWLFSVMTSFVAMLFFVATSGKFEWNSGYVLYSLGFAIAYACATVFNVAAIAYGSLSLTTLIISYSLMLPTLYGLFFLKDEISMGFVPGIALLVISLVLINAKKEKQQVSLKWLVCVFLAFVGNGMCSVTQKMQQTAFDGAYKNEFMIVALMMVVIMLGIVMLVKEHKEIKLFAKAGIVPSIVGGIANGVTNFLVMILASMMPASVMFPLISAGGIIITYFVSRFVYKEKLTKIQLVGVVLGIGSVVFLSI